MAFVGITLFLGVLCFIVGMTKEDTPAVLVGFVLIVIGLVLLLPWDISTSEKLMTYDEFKVEYQKELATQGIGFYFVNPTNGIVEFKLNVLESE